MKGIYLTEEGKAEIQTKIAELKDIIEKYKKCKNWMWFDAVGQIEVYKQILATATILPVDNNYVSSKYPNGLIIQPKQ